MTEAEVIQVEQKGATSDPTFTGLTLADKIEVYGKNLAGLAQIVVNTHHDLIRFQMIMDAILDGNKDKLIIPGEEVLKAIDARAAKETKAHFPQFFVDNKDAPSTT